MPIAVGMLYRDARRNDGEHFGQINSLVSWIRIICISQKSYFIHTGNLKYFFGFTVSQSTGSIEISECGELLGQITSPRPWIRIIYTSQKSDFIHTGYLNYFSGSTVCITGPAGCSRSALVDCTEE